MIKKIGNAYVLYTKDGSRRLGMHKTKASAEKQERVIQLVKSKRDK